MCVQRYGLWDHEGPLEEQSPSSESCRNEGKTRDEDEDGRKKEGEGEEEEGRDSSISILENLETELDHPKMVGQIFVTHYWLLPINQSITFKKCVLVH